MRVSRFVQKLISWIACAAVLMGSLGPMLTHALERSPGNGWVEVCTALGAKWVEAIDDNQQTPIKAPADHAQQHCPYCASHVTALGMPPATASALVLPRLAVGLPDLFLLGPRTLFAWSTAQPRAPPSLS